MEVNIHSKNALLYSRCSCAQIDILYCDTGPYLYTYRYINFVSSEVFRMKYYLEINGYILTKDQLRLYSSNMKKNII